MNKKLLNLFVASILMMKALAYELPQEVINGVANDLWGSKFSPAIASDDLKSYFLKNWRQISANVEMLPTHKFDPEYNKERVLSVHSAFYEACEGLKPLEYTDFLDQILILYEKKRITDGEFQYVICPRLEKHNFLSVNYEHPRVAALLKKAIALIPPEMKSLKLLLEKSASGALADNYKTNKGDDAPLPETLPGIELKRPWDSLIKKYERATGKKLPPDPDFPKDADRPSKRAGRKGESGFDDVESSATNHSSGLLYWIGLPFLTILGVFVWLKWKCKKQGGRIRG